MFYIAAEGSSSPIIFYELYEALKSFKNISPFYVLRVVLISPGVIFYIFPLVVPVEFNKYGALNTSLNSQHYSRASANEVSQLFEWIKVLIANSQSGWLPQHGKTTDYLVIWLILCVWFHLMNAQTSYLRSLRHLTLFIPLHYFQSVRLV